MRLPAQARGAGASRGDRLALALARALALNLALLLTLALARTVAQAVTRTPKPNPGPDPDPNPDPNPDPSAEPSQVRHEDTNVVRYVAGALQNLVARLRLTSTHWEQLSYLTELSRSAPRTRTRTRRAAAWMRRVAALST